MLRKYNKEYLKILFGFLQFRHALKAKNWTYCEYKVISKAVFEAISLDFIHMLSAPAICPRVYNYK